MTGSAVFGFYTHGVLTRGTGWSSRWSCPVSFQTAIFLYLSSKFLCRSVFAFVKGQHRVTKAAIVFPLFSPVPGFTNSVLHILVWAIRALGRSNFFCGYVKIIGSHLRNVKNFLYSRLFGQTEIKDWTSLNSQALHEFNPEFHICFKEFAV